MACSVTFMELSRSDKNKRIKLLMSRLEEITEKLDATQAIRQEVRQIAAPDCPSSKWEESHFRDFEITIREMQSFISNMYMQQVRALLPSEQEVITRCITEAPRDF